MNITRERVWVAGPGAIGSLVAAKLKRAGVDIHLLDHRADRAEQIARDGITIEEHGARWSVHPAVSANPAAVAGAGLLIVCVKAYSTTTLYRQLAPYLEPHTVVLSLQNGLGNIETLMLTPATTVLAGITGIGAMRTAAGHVQCTGSGRTGVAAARGPEAAADRAVDLLRQATMDAYRHPDWRTLLWTKLILNAAVNPLTARYRICNGALPAHPQAGPLSRRILGEGVAVAIATGIPLDMRQMLADLDDLCSRTAGNRSSMLRDADAGKPTELQAITGAVVAQADTLGIPVPVNRWMLHPDDNRPCPPDLTH